MAVTLDDVVQCYVTFFDRLPETEDVIQRHAAKYATVWDMIKEFMDSHEFMTTRIGRNHLSIKKCYDGNYLARSFDRKVGIDCFLNHQLTLQRQLVPYCVEQILFDEQIIVQGAAKGVDFFVTIFATRDVIREGELALELHVDNQPLYRVSFSFIRGDAVGLPSDRQGLLISRMQGQAGKWAEIRAATKALREVSPQSLLFSALEGIGQASQSSFIAGVTAANHVSPTKDNDAFERVYDDFFKSIDCAKLVDGFYVMDLPLRQKPLTMITAMHRVRSRKKREFRSSIAALAAKTWVGWATDDVHASIPTAKPTWIAGSSFGGKQPHAVGGLDHVPG